MSYVDWAGEGTGKRSKDSQRELTGEEGCTVGSAVGSGREKEEEESSEVLVGVEDVEEGKSRLFCSTGGGEDLKGSCSCV